MGRDHSCEGCGLGGFNADPDMPSCICGSGLGLRSCDFTTDGCVDPECHYCYSIFSATALACLAANLAQAGALCEAFRQGKRWPYFLDADDMSDDYSWSIAAALAFRPGHAIHARGEGR